MHVSLPRRNRHLILVVRFLELYKYIRGTIRSVRAEGFASASFETYVGNNVSIACSSVATGTRGARTRAQESRNPGCGALRAWPILANIVNGDDHSGVRCVLRPRAACNVQHARGSRIPAIVQEMSRPRTRSSFNGSRTGEPEVRENNTHAPIQPRSGAVTAVGHPAPSQGGSTT
jgi:hypothetical protein